MSNFTELKNKYELAQFLEISLKTLNFLTIHKSAKKYLVKEIPKKTGGVRKLYIPNKKLKEIQKMIAQELSVLYKPRNCAFAYIKGRNIKNNAEKHLNKKWVLRLDLKDFFETIHFGRVRGIFIHLGFLPEVATVLAQLCTYEGILPQGSPTSPVISNIIASGLDKDLSSLAKKSNCFYTRYSDDLYFSCNRKNFPKDLAYFKEDGSNSSCQIGDILRVELENHGFYPNDKKTYLADNSSRKHVTGVVVNQKLNVNKSFIRELRVLIHKCELDAEGFSKKYLEEKKKNIFSVLNGKVEFLGFIRGYDDCLYKKYALKISKIKGSKFVFNKRNLSFGDGNVIDLYCEGKTDYNHLENALSFFKSNGVFTDLEICFKRDNELLEGDADLIKAYSKVVGLNKESKIFGVFVFDNDSFNTVKEIDKIKTTIKSYQILVLPKPYPNVDQYCIEDFYHFDDIKKVKDENGRRIYLRSEFDENGFHREENLVYTDIRKKSIIADSSVFDCDRKINVALTKSDFSNLISSKYKGQIKYDRFESVFSKIKEMKDDFYNGNKQAGSIK